MLAAYFHFNDYIALNQIGKGTGGWTTPWEPAVRQRARELHDLPGNFLEMLLNAAYNQGYYGTLVSKYSKLGATATAATVTSVNAWSYVVGQSTTPTSSIRTRCATTWTSSTTCRCPRRGPPRWSRRPTTSHSRWPR